MTHSQYVTLRNLLCLAIALLLATVGSNIYAGLKLDANSRVFERIYTLLETGMGERFATAMAQAKAIERELSQARGHAQGAVESMQTMETQFRKAAADAENSLVERLNRELPVLMDRYIESRAAKLRESASREEIRKVLREELAGMLREELRGPAKK